MNANRKLFRGLLINPVAKTVTEVQTSGELQELYRLLECRTVEIVPVSDGGETLWIDEEGLYAEPPKEFFSFLGHETNPLCGNGLILGSDGKGGHADCRLPLKLVADRVVFRNIQFDTIRTTESADEHGFVIRQTARFKPKGD